MAEVPNIDLHPNQLPQGGPEMALQACRQFLEQALAKGWSEVRVITGLGLHGDGTPRLRLRVEREVLAPLAARIISVESEQGGAVLRILLRPAPRPPELRQLRIEQERRERIHREERLLVARDRLHTAATNLQEGDLRRARLKLNQLVREFAPEQGRLGKEENLLRQALAIVKKKIDALI